jgi:hypothetical protein
MFLYDQAIIQWTEINTKDYKIALASHYQSKYICQPTYKKIVF